MLEDPSEREIPCVSAALGAAEGFLSRARNSRDARIKVAALRFLGHISASLRPQSAAHLLPRSRLIVHIFSSDSAAGCQSKLTQSRQVSDELMVQPADSCVCFSQKPVMNQAT